ncbi:hypothetical protein LTR17_021503 [Elasticomyces elasticus]|nr:hypothetical protein LTR17_021503 [Elasticomyces elasticus]
MASEADVTDPKDRVYALLGVIPNNESRLIVPDYTLPTWEIYAQATYASVAGTRTLDILAVTPAARSSELDLPSWVVDFSTVPFVATVADTLALWRRNGVIGLYDTQQVKVSVSWPCCELTEEDMPAQISLDRRFLKIIGVRFCNIVASHSFGARDMEPEIALASSAVQPKLARHLCDLLAIAMRQLICDTSPTHEQSHEKIVCYNDESVENLTPLELYKMTIGSWWRVSSKRWDHYPLTMAWFRHWSDTMNLRTVKGGRVVSKGVDTKDVRDSSFSSAVFQFFDYADAREILQFFVLTNGTIGLACAILEADDTVVLIKGGKYPFVLKRSSSEWILKGICLIPSIMQGELIEVWGGLDLKEETFDLC